jgi:hypothetical protein
MRSHSRSFVEFGRQCDGAGGDIRITNGNIPDQDRYCKGLKSAQIMKHEERNLQVSITLSEFSKKNCLKFKASQEKCSTSSFVSSGLFIACSANAWSACSELQRWKSQGTSARQARSGAEVAHILARVDGQERRQRNEGSGTYLEEFATKLTPASMLVLRPLMASSRSFFSYELALDKMLMAFSAPSG